MKHLLQEGAQFLVERDLGTAGDLEHTEANGFLDGGDSAALSDRAIERGQSQCGTLGSGNHFLEVQVVDHVFDVDTAKTMGLEKDMICVMIHSGSRGLGYQVCDDALADFRKAPEKYGIDLPDRQLACAPVESPEGQHYITAMRSAANFAWCNRQLLMQQTRLVFAEVFGRTWESMQMNLVYDVCHNIAKFEEHIVEGKKKRLWVHRKGATRAFPAHHPEIPSAYRSIGQPVIIPGDMGRASWVLVGQPGSMEKTFGTTCHGLASSAVRPQRESRPRIDKELEGREDRLAQSWRVRQNSPILTRMSMMWSTSFRALPVAKPAEANRRHQGLAAENERQKQSRERRALARRSRCPTIPVGGYCGRRCFTRNSSDPL